MPHVALELYLEGIPSADLELETLRRAVEHAQERINHHRESLVAMCEKQNRRCKELQRQKARLARAQVKS